NGFEGVADEALGIHRHRCPAVRCRVGLGPAGAQRARRQLHERTEAVVRDRAVGRAGRRGAVGDRNPRLAGTAALADEDHLLWCGWPDMPTVLDGRQYPRPWSGARRQREGTARMTQEVEPAWAGRYRLGRLQGTGSVAIVYRALDLRQGRQVAVKLFHPDPDPVMQRRFAAEARALARLSHPGLVSIYDAG